MTDTPQTTLIPAWIHSYTAFIKAHEKMILIGLSALVLWHFGDKITQWFDNKHTAQQQQTNQQIAVQEAQNENLKQQLVQMKLNFDALKKSLDAKIDARKQAVIVQQKVDAALPLPELSTRWETLLTLSSGSVVPQTDGTIAISTDAAHATVNELEKVPQLIEQVADTQTELKECTTLSSQKDITITGLNTSIDLEKKGRLADALVAKDNQRKSFWRGFKLGAVAGFVGGVLALHKI